MGSGLGGLLQGGKWKWTSIGLHHIWLQTFPDGPYLLAKTTLNIPMEKIDVDCSQSGNEETEIMKKTLFVHINIKTIKGKIL